MAHELTAKALQYNKEVDALIATLDKAFKMAERLIDNDLVCGSLYDSLDAISREIVDLQETIENECKF